MNQHTTFLHKGHENFKNEDHSQKGKKLGPKKSKPHQNGRKQPKQNQNQQDNKLHEPQKPTNPKNSKQGKGNPPPDTKKIIKTAIGQKTPVQIAQVWLDKIAKDELVGVINKQGQIEECYLHVAFVNQQAVLLVIPKRIKCKLLPQYSYTFTHTTWEDVI